MHSWDAGDLNLGNGLLVIIDRALASLQPGEIARIVSRDLAGADDVVGWCKIAAHQLVVENTADGDSICYTITKGNAKRLLFDRELEWGTRAELGPSGQFDTKRWLVGRFGDIPDHADPTRGFAPRGALLELHSPEFPFSINDKSKVWAAEVMDLYDQAVANQWDGARDIPWGDLPSLPDEIEQSVCQVMTFLIENEYSALYVPGKFISRINSQYLEVVLFLSTQLMDEARHIEVFTKRALANGGGLQGCTASTEYSLKTLYEQNDFSCASFLLSVLGEGTFLDLLKFIEEVAPDSVTREIARRARVDETRHVHFGMAHIKYLLAHEPDEAGKLIRAVQERARVLQEVTSINELVSHSLAILAGGGLQPEQLKRGTKKVSELIRQMDDNRRKRLSSIGFSSEQAAEISAFHTPNFM
jgi:TusA-related sulfurtransferase